MQRKFLDAEEEFGQLKRKFRLGKVTRQEFIERLEKLRLKDDDGRFWMIGAKSGNWYYFDGKNWVQSEPPSLADKKAICIYCGFENKLEAEVCGRCGELLGEEAGKMKTQPKLEASFQASPVYIREEREKDFAERREGAHFIFRSVNSVSFLIFSATAGLLAGIILGSLIGATNFFSGIVKSLPAFFQETQGNLLGGIIYAVLGGIVGLAGLGLLGFLNALFINLISSLVGGIKIHFEKKE